ncbi:MAG: uncharacterized protein JWP97_3256 [Labilithrix sp.]|nr:uncharacterized protein [Labilithrix sp.]
MANVLTRESGNFPRVAPPVDAIIAAPHVAALARPIPDVAFLSALAVIPATVGLVTAAVLGGRAARAGLWAGLGAAGGLGLMRWQMQRLFTTEPRYEVLRKVGRLEVRSYPTLVRAETTVRGHAWRGALDEGFGRLARYIYGGNEEQEHIEMTTPVTTFRNESDLHPNEHDAVDVSFVMPEGRTLASLPVPVDERIHLVEDAPRHVAVLRFAGSFDIELTRRKQRELFTLVEKAGLKPVGDPGFAGYDPPSTLPLLRRNEVWMEVGP